MPLLPGFINPPAPFRADVSTPARGGALAAAQVAAGTTYYIRKTGSDGAAGTTPGTAWASFGKALGASGINSGDTVYVGAGIYRETVSVAMTSPTVPTRIIGDVDGAQTGDAGEVILSAFTGGDTAAVAATTTLDLATRNFLWFSKMTVIGGNASTSCLNIPFNTRNFSFVDVLCVSISRPRAISIASTPGVYLNGLLDRVTAVTKPQNAADGVILVSLSRAGTDYDCGVTIQNSVLTGGGIHCVRISSTASNSTGNLFGGGVIVRQCTMFGLGGVTTGDANLSTAIPVTVSGSLMIGDNGVQATVAGQIVEDHNYIAAATPRTLVAVGAGSNTLIDHAPLLYLGQEGVVGLQRRPFLMPSANSPLLGYGSPLTPTTYDVLGNPRPGGIVQQAVGAYQRDQAWGRETGTVRTGANALSILGPGIHDFVIPVDTTATNVAVWMQTDAAYTGPSPSLQLLPNQEIGVTALEAPFSAASGTWQQLVLPPFTPTAQGIVTVRLTARDTSGAGHTYADDFTIT